jgi:hypothetical protein
MYFSLEEFIWMKIVICKQYGCFLLGSYVPGLAGMGWVKRQITSVWVTYLSRRVFEPRISPIRSSDNHYTATPFASHSVTFHICQIIPFHVTSTELYVLAGRWFCELCVKCYLYVVNCKHSDSAKLWLYVKLESVEVTDKKLFLWGSDTPRKC